MRVSEIDRFCCPLVFLSTNNAFLFANQCVKHEAEDEDEDEKRSRLQEHKRV